jgi:hypothetical protein
MNSDVIILILTVGVLAGVASLGVWRNRYNGAWVWCALTPMGFASFITVDAIDAFVTDPVSLRMDDIATYGPPYAAMVLPIYLAGLVSLVRMYRKNKESLGNNQVSASNS